MPILDMHLDGAFTSEKWLRPILVRSVWRAIGDRLAVEYLLNAWMPAMSSWGQRRDDRVNFERGISVHIIAIDGTWRRGCKLLDISQSGARLLMDDTIGGLNLKEFFLCLSQSGSVFRRCELIRVNGDEVGVHFLEKGPKKKMANSGKRQPGSSE